MKTDKNKNSELVKAFCSIKKIENVSSEGVQEWVQSSEKWRWGSGAEVFMYDEDEDAFIFEFEANDVDELIFGILKTEEIKYDIYDFCDEDDEVEEC
jgi:hypothetical protein